MFYREEQYGFAYVDLSTGELKSTTLAEADGVVNESSALQTKEMVLGSELPETLQTSLSTRLNIVFFPPSRSGRKMLNSAS